MFKYKDDKNLDKNKLTYSQMNYIRYYLTESLSEDILLKRFGYRHLEEVPKELFKDIKKSLISIRNRISRDKAAWLKNHTGEDYVPRPVYEKNVRVF